jgi:hypothetical protein
MLQKYILQDHSIPGASIAQEKDIAMLATVFVTSEAVDSPIDHAFDYQRGPGGSRWVAGKAGEQKIILVFDTPQTIRTICLEIEEREVSRTQELHLSVMGDGIQEYRELPRQEYHFSPPDTTFEHEEWAVTAENITHLQLVLKPDKGRQLTANDGGKESKGFGVEDRGHNRAY